MYRPGFLAQCRVAVPLFIVVEVMARKRLNDALLDVEGYKIAQLFH